MSLGDFIKQLDNAWPNKWPGRRGTLSKCKDIPTSFSLWEIQAAEVVVWKRGLWCGVSGLTAHLSQLTLKSPKIISILCEVGQGRCIHSQLSHLLHLQKLKCIRRCFSLKLHRVGRRSQKSVESEALPCSPAASRNKHCSQATQCGVQVLPLS